MKQLVCATFAALAFLACTGGCPAATTTTTPASTTTTTTNACFSACCAKRQIELTSAPFDRGLTIGHVRALTCSGGSQGGAPCNLDADCDRPGTCTGPAANVMDLLSGGLYFGGGGLGVPLPAAVPDLSVTILNVQSCDPGTGTFALGPTTPAAAGPGDRRCTSGSSVTNTEYPAHAAGCLFGPPLPIPNVTSSAISTCLINRVAADASGTATCTGDVTLLHLPLLSDLYLTGPTRLLEPCPLCLPRAQVSGCTHTFCCDSGPNAGASCTAGSGGSKVCLGGPNNGKSCTSNAAMCGSGTCNRQYPTSHDCPPEGTVFLGSLRITLDLTTGAQAKTASAKSVFCGNCASSSGGASSSFVGHCAGGPNAGDACHGIRDCGGSLAGGSCVGEPCTVDSECSSYTTGCGPAGTSACRSCRQRNPGAFGAGSAKTISATGVSPDACLTPGTHDVNAVSVFCIPPTFDSTVDPIADLPGPGAASLPARVRMLP